MATTLKTDSPLSRRIVTAFLDFLNSVEPAPGVDLEGLEVAKECLAQVFKIDPSVETKENENLLVSLFGPRGVTEQQECKPDLRHETSSAGAPSTSSAETASHAINFRTSKALDEDWIGEAPALGAFEDDLFGQFFGALEKIRYFKPAPDGHDDQNQLDRATQTFFYAVMEIKKRSGQQAVNAKNLAETFKSQGNKAMQSKQYSEAIELYTFAIALCEDNAVYYCNRAAAYTQIHQYGEAISDSLKSIEIDPNYSKAYSRLGFAYYALGNYRDAIDEGFMKALQLDPNNDSVKENIRVAEQKLRERQRNGHNQSSSPEGHQESFQQSAGGGSRSQTMPPPFTSMPFNANGLPADIASMFMNMASNMHQGPHSQDRQEASSHADTFSEPEIRLGANVNMNLGEQMPEERRPGGNININLGDRMPEELTGALRSVMQMFSGPSPPLNRQDDTHGGSAPS